MADQTIALEAQPPDINLGPMLQYYADLPLKRAEAAYYDAHGRLVGTQATLAQRGADARQGLVDEMYGRQQAVPGTTLDKVAQPTPNGPTLGTAAAAMPGGSAPTVASGATLGTFDLAHPTPAMQRAMIDSPETLAGWVKLQQDQAGIGKTLSDTQIQMANHTRDRLANVAQSVSTLPADQQPGAYLQGLDQLAAEKTISPEYRDYWAKQPYNPQLMQALINGALKPEDYYTVTGQKAGNEARAKLPFEKDLAGFKAGAEGAAAIRTAQATPRIVPAGGVLFNPMGGGGAPAAGGSPPGAAPAPAPAIPMPASTLANAGTPAAQTAPGAAPAPAVTPTQQQQAATNLQNAQGLRVAQVGGGTTFTNPNSPAMINLNQGNVPKYMDVTGEGVGKFINDKQAGVGGAAQALTMIHELREAMQGLPSGPGTVSVNDASSFLSRFGVDINKVLPTGWQTDPTKEAIAQKNITQLAAAYAKSEFPTRITNNDMQIAMQATPNLFNNERANNVLLDNLEAVQRLKLDEAKFYRNYAHEQPQGTAPDWTIIDAWHDHVKDLKGVPENIKQSYLGFNDLPAGTPGMGTTNGPSPTNIPAWATRSGKDSAGKPVYERKPGEWVYGDGTPY